MRKFQRFHFRIPTNTPRSPTPPTYTYIWEDDYLLWLNGTRDRYIEDLTSRSKTGETYGQSPASSNSTSRPDSQRARFVSIVYHTCYCCTVVYCTALCCIVLCCTLHSTVVYCLMLLYCYCTVH